MPEKFQDLKREIDSLDSEGELLFYAMAYEVGKLSEEFKDRLKAKGIDLPNFQLSYDTWYSKSLRVIKQVLPERLSDFVLQYKNEKRKEVGYLTYGIADYLIGLRTTRGTEIVVDRVAALPRMENQRSILSAAKARFESTLFDIREVLQADLFDSELAAATELSKKGFARAAGAVAGVVLEKHLGQVCQAHGLKSRKSHPTISEFNQLLKDADVIDTPKWRFIQHLTDLRNLCDHAKDREPTKDDISELISGTDKVIKTVF